MIDRVWRVRFCLALLSTLAVCLLMAGCRLDRGECPPATTTMLHGKPPCANRGCDGSCSGYQPTVWQPWQDGCMAMRCNQGEVVYAPGQIETANPGSPSASRPLQETIPVPDARKSSESRTAIVPEPPRSEPVTPGANANGAPGLPRQGNVPAPADQPVVPLPVRPAEQPPLSPPPPSKNTVEPSPGDAQPAVPLPVKPAEQSPISPPPPSNNPAQPPPGDAQPTVPQPAKPPAQPAISPPLSSNNTVEPSPGDTQPTVPQQPNLIAQPEVSPPLSSGGTTESVSIRASEPPVPLQASPSERPEISLLPSSNGATERVSIRASDLGVPLQANPSGGLAISLPPSSNGATEPVSIRASEPAVPLQAIPSERPATPPPPSSNGATEPVSIRASEPAVPLQANPSERPSTFSPPSIDNLGESKETIAPQSTLPEKVAISARLTSEGLSELVTTAPEGEAVVARFGDVEPESVSKDAPRQSDVIPAFFFTHSPPQQEASSKPNEPPRLSYP